MTGPRRRRPARLAVLVALTAVALLLGAPAGWAQAPDAVGWWTSLPVPPDVTDDDLLLQGGDPVRALPDTGELDRSPAPTALAALRFAVPEGAGAGALVLAVAAGAQAADVRAYPTASRWEPARAGAREEAPTLDRSRYAQGVLSADGATLTFADVGRLLPDDGQLSVVLVAGPLDRVVIHRPGPLALSVTPADAGLPPVLAPVAGPFPGPPLDPAFVPAVLGPPVAAAAPLAVPPAASLQAPPALLPAPATAGPVQAAAGRLVADDGRTRVLVGLEALLLLVLFGLLGQGPLAVLARLTGQPVGVRAERGIGRFARARTGRPPAL